MNLRMLVVSLCCSMLAMHVVLHPVSEMKPHRPNLLCYHHLLFTLCFPGIQQINRQALRGFRMHRVGLPAGGAWQGCWGWRRPWLRGSCWCPAARGVLHPTSSRTLQEATWRSRW